LSASNASPGVDLRRLGVSPLETLVAEEKRGAADFKVPHLIIIIILSAALCSHV
jgi:hypothetical protein